MRFLFTSFRNVCTKSLLLLLEPIIYLLLDSSSSSYSTITYFTSIPNSLSLSLSWSCILVSQWKDLRETQETYINSELFFSTRMVREHAIRRKNEDAHLPWQTQDNEAKKKHGIGHDIMLTQTGWSQCNLGAQRTGGDWRAYLNPWLTRVIVFSGTSQH